MHPFRPPSSSSSPPPPSPFAPSPSSFSIALSRLFTRSFRRKGPSASSSSSFPSPSSSSSPSPTTLSFFFPSDVIHHERLSRLLSRIVIEQELCLEELNAKSLTPLPPPSSGNFVQYLSADLPHYPTLFQLHESFWSVVKSEIHRINDIALSHQTQARDIFNTQIHAQLEHMGLHLTHPIPSSASSSSFSSSSSSHVPSAVCPAPPKEHSLLFAQHLLSSFPHTSVLDKAFIKQAMDYVPGPSSSSDASPSFLFDSYFSLCQHLDSIHKFALLNYLVLLYSINHYDLITVRHSEEFFEKELVAEPFLSLTLLGEVETQCDAVLNHFIPRIYHSRAFAREQRDQCDYCGLPVRVPVMLECMCKVCAVHLYLTNSQERSAAPQVSSDDLSSLESSDPFSLPLSSSLLYRCPCCHQSITLSCCSIELVIERARSLSLYDSEGSDGRREERNIEQLPDYPDISLAKGPPSSSSSSPWTDMHFPAPQSVAGLPLSASSSSLSTIASSSSAVHSPSPSFPTQSDKGVSCHKCKVSKPPSDLLYCSASRGFRPSPSLPPSSHDCHKKYCQPCLQRHPPPPPSSTYYSPSFQWTSFRGPQGKGWICPASLNCCVCKSCTRDRERQEREGESNREREGDTDTDTEKKVSKEKEKAELKDANHALPSVSERKQSERQVTDFSPFSPFSSHSVPSGFFAPPPLVPSFCLSPVPFAPPSPALASSSFADMSSLMASRPSFDAYTGDMNTGKEEKQRRREEEEQIITEPVFHEDL